MVRPTRPAEASGKAGWLTPALGVLAAVLTVVAGVVGLAGPRLGQAGLAWVNVYGPRDWAALGSATTIDALDG